MNPHRLCARKGKYEGLDFRDEELAYMDENREKDHMPANGYHPGRPKQAGIGTFMAMMVKDNLHQRNKQKELYHWFNSLKSNYKI